ncbi:MAG: chemoreceptor glutamine deamidase CheD [Cellvibrionaceae bacterium]
MYIGNEKDDKKVHRFWDKSREAFCVKILPGEYYYTTTNELISTTLGSCVSACIWDEEHKVGGMNHFMLPLTEKQENEVTWGDVATDATRYGNYAMEYLINEILKHGGEKSKFQVKLFGGGKVLEGTGNVGQKNVNFVLDYVKTEGLNLVSQDLGDVYPRKVLFDPLTGRAWMKRIKDANDKTLAAREREYRKTINTEPVSGDVDLF